MKPPERGSSTSAIRLVPFTWGPVDVASAGEGPGLTKTPRLAARSEEGRPLNAPPESYEVDVIHLSGWELATLGHDWEDDDVLVVQLSGEVDVSNVDALHNKISQVLRANTRCIVFDLRALEFIDSSGLSMLVTLANEVGSARLRSPSRVVRRIVDLTGLGELLPTEGCSPTEP
ncbi:MAG TPA: STAS domain-containing protein [Acidimicrobiales bacterium]|nr:STAS domain-containing protein [Acidimicrobiales bacterium]